MNSLITEMNNKLDMQLNDWPELFKDEMRFSQNEKGYLCFNNLPLYKGDCLLLNSIEFALNHFTFYFDKERFIRIELLWKEDTEPVVSSVMFGHSVHKHEDYTDLL